MTDHDDRAYHAQVPPHHPGQPVARRTDPATSHAAAASVLNETGTRSRLAVLRLLMDGPLTQEEMVDLCHVALDASSGDRADAWRFTDSRLRTAVKELAVCGYVMDSGARRPTRTGRNAIVWKAGPFIVPGSTTEEARVAAAVDAKPKPGRSRRTPSGKIRVGLHLERRETTSFRPWSGVLYFEQDGYPPRQLAPLSLTGDEADALRALLDQQEGNQS